MLSAYHALIAARVFDHRHLERLVPQPLRHLDVAAAQLDVGQCPGGAGALRCARLGHAHRLLQQRSGLVEVAPPVVSPPQCAKTAGKTGTKAWYGSKARSAASSSM